MYLSLLKFLSVLIAGLLALGNVSSIFGLDGSIGPVEVALVAFGGAYFLAFPRDILIALTRTKAYVILLIAFFFAVADLFYGSSEYGDQVFNIKLAVCVIFFCVLVSYFSRFPTELHRSLFAFSLVSIIYVALVLYVIPGATATVKGQLIVFGENPNSTSSRLAVSFVYLFGFCIQNPLSWPKWRFVLLLALVPSLILIVESGSRGSLIAVIFALLVYLGASRIRFKYKLGMAGLALIAIPYLLNYLLSRNELADRWVNAAGGDTAGRGDIWTDAFNIFLTSPFFGVGESGYFQEIYHLRGVFIDTHNVFIYVAVCGGIVSLILFSIFLVGLFKRARASARLGDVFPLVLLVYMILIASKTGGVLTYLLMWYVFSVVYTYVGAMVATHSSLLNLKK